MTMGRSILLIAGLAMVPFPVWAGFDFDKTKYSIHIKNDLSQPGSPSPDAEGEGAVRPPSDPYAPSLQTYEERYVPNTVKDKYEISNDWYGADEAREPVQLRPAASLPGSEQDKNDTARWIAAQGDSLQDVLQTWSESEGAELIWQAGEKYTLKKPVRQSGNFEDAVFQVMGQYDKDRVRPFGQLYTDPATGQKTLVVHTDTAF